LIAPRGTAIEILIKFNDGPDRDHPSRVVAHSAASGRRYLFVRKEREWAIASPVELEADVRILNRIITLKWSALGLLGHQ
jgi:hypothetical protein